MLGKFLVTKEVDSKKYIICITQSKGEVDLYTGNDIDYVHWDCDLSGECPKIAPTDSNGDFLSGSEFVDIRTYDEKRKAAYLLEADHLYIEAQGNIADGMAEATALEPWTTKKNEIKIKYPSS